MMYTTLRTVIFDIDGTLSNPEHRLHYVTNGKKDWDAFLTGCGEDTPYQEIIDLCNAVENTCSHLLLVTGRSERFRETTEEWLERHGVRYRELHMRPEGDYRPDYVIKSEILDRLLADGHEIDFVVDDRQTVIDMWRNELGFDLIGKHFQTFNSQKADILKGDKLPNVEVLVVNA